MSEILISEKKYIICDYARADWGKSATTKRVIAILKKQSCIVSEKTVFIGDSKDEYGKFITDSGVKIAVVTQGDPDSRQEEYLGRAANEFKADVIICTARSSGDTVDNIYKIATDYEKIWYRNFYADNWTQQFGDFLNENSAVGVLKLVGNLFNIKALKSL